MNALASKISTLTTDQLKETLKAIKDQSGEHIALLWHDVTAELEARMGEDSFWEWADSGQL